MEEEHKERTGVLYGVIVVLTLITLAKAFIIFDLLQDNAELLVERDRVLKAFNACDTQLQGLNWLRNNNDIIKPAE